MKTTANNYRGHRFPTEIISHGIWLYYRFSLSLRDVEEILAERGISVTHETIRQWCRKFGPEYARKLKRRQGRLGDVWRLVADRLRSYAAAHRNLMPSVDHDTDRPANYRLMRERSFKEWSAATAA